MLPLGQELKRRGHRVTLAGLLDTKPRIVAAGLDFLPVGEEDFPPGAIAASLAKL
jgi:UDP:flavonoid glycosyltransferase YjiC (YdhE family)